MPDAPPAPDARLPDATPPAPDAAPTIDATPGIDADTTPDATPCVSDEECTEAGTTCNGDGQQITCEEVQTGCFQVDEGTDPADCGTNQACVAGSGCVCNENPNCEAAGEFCTDDGVLTCTEDDDGCLINDDAVACADPTVCDPDAGGEGHAECVCPSVGTEAGTGCMGTAVNTITCSGDDSDVIRCDVVGEAQCQVWTSLDDCASDGLECNDNDCVCPDVTDTNEFFADPVVNREGRPPEEITPTGARNPAICSFEEMSTAIAFAIDASGPGNIFDTFAVASNDTAPGTPAVFRKEALPWPKIPDNVTVTNTGSSDVGGPGELAPELWIIEVNSHDPNLLEVGQHPNASVHLSGRVNRNVPGSRGGAIQGLTFVAGPCRFDLDNEECQLPETAIYMDGYSNVENVDSSLEARIYSVNIFGHGGEPSIECDDGSALTGGTFEANAANSDVFLFEAPADLAGCEDDGPFDGVNEGDWFVIDSGPNAGAWKVADTKTVDDLHGGDNFAVVGLELIGTGVAGDATGTWSVFPLYSTDSGQNPWRFGFVGDGNGYVYDLHVRGFDSDLAVCNSSRAGVMVVGNFSTDDDEQNQIVFDKPNLDENDIGYLHENAVAHIVAAQGGDFPGDQGTIHGNHLAGVLMEEGVLSVDDILIDATDGSGFGCNIADGDGIRVLNYGNSTATFSGVVSTDNVGHGAFIGNDNVCGRELICFNEDGWDVPAANGENTGTRGQCEPVQSGNGGSGGTEPNVQFVEAGFVDMSDTQLSFNHSDGLHVTDFGTVVQNGGQISSNDDQGIEVDGCSIVNTNSGEGGDSEPLQVADNDFEGIFVNQGEVNATSTEISRNGQANRCDGEDDIWDAASAGVWVEDSGTFHGQNLLIDENRGAGAVFLNDGSDNYEVDEEPRWTGGSAPVVALPPPGPAKLPAIGEDSSRPNTLEDSLVTLNHGALDTPELEEGDTDCSDETVFDFDEGTDWPVAGVHVDDDGHLQFVNSTQSDAGGNANNIIDNDKYGLWVSGVVDRFTPARDLDTDGDDTESSSVVNINDNGWTGAVTENRNGAVLQLNAGTVNNNGAAMEDEEGNVIGDGLTVHGGKVTVVGTIFDLNADDGIVADALASDFPSDESDEYAASNTEITLTNITVTNSGDDGLFLHGAPGQLGVVNSHNQEGTMMDPDPRLDPNRGENDFNGDVTNPYGIIINGTDAGARPCSTVVNQPGACIHDNGGDGIDIGVSDQDINVTVFMDLGEVFGNGGTGVRMQQSGDFVPGDSTCANDFGGIGCSGATIHGVISHDNIDSGFEFETSFIIPRRIGNTFYGMGWTSNKVFHNAIGAGCSAPQSQPQVMMRGVTAQDPAICDDFDSDQDDCEDFGDDSSSTEFNLHCYWTGSTCLAIWDMRGALDCGDNTANPNQIHSYNTNTDPVGSSELSVGMYAQDGADVWADNNSWRTGDEAQNVDQDASSFIDADTICPAGGILLQCSDQ